MQSGFKKLGLVALLLVFCASFMIGQGIVTGSIIGTAVDQQGAVVPGAKVTAVQQGTNTSFTTTSNDTGAFQLRGLPVGSYNVTIEASKFSKLKINDVAVTSNGQYNLGSQTLKAGGAETEITVEGTAPLVETTTSQVSSSYTSRQVSDLPIGTNIDQLALLTPGVASTHDNNFSNTNGASISSNGQRGRSNNFQIDGQSNNDNSVAGPSIFLGNQDAIAEYQIVTNNFSAEYGRNSGSVINYVTKSGTNNWHGTAFENWLGDSTFSRTNEEKSPVFGFCPSGVAEGTATDWSGACTKSTVPKYVENRFGGTAGGPVFKDRSWFFVSYQEDRIRQTQSPFQSGSSLTPTPAGVTALAAAFPNNPGVLTLQKYGPTAIAAGNPTFNSAGTFNITDGVTTVPIEFGSVTRNLPNLFKDRQGTGRFDWQLGSKDRFFARYVYEDTADTNVTGRGAAGMQVDVPGIDQQIGLDWTRNWTNNFVNQARFSYSRAKFGFEAGTTGCTQQTILTCPSGFSFSGAPILAFGLQNNLPQGRLINNTQYQDNATFVRGRHTWKFGGEYDRQRSPNVFLPNINGTFTYTSGAAGCAGGDVGCLFSSFISNTPAQLSLTDGPPSFNFKEQDMSFYGQDDWRIKDNLTLNLGMRWEWTQQAVNLLHDLTVKTQTGPNPFWDTTLPLSRTTFPKVDEDFNNFGPNIGFAWTPKIWRGIFGEDKTVIRGGYRIAYDPEFYNMFLNAATAAPVVNAGTILGAAAAIPAGGAPTGASLRAAGYLANIPTGADPGTRNQTLVTQNFHNPYTQQWQLGVQRQISSKVAFETRYVGNHTVGNFETINSNPKICDRLDATGNCNRGLAFDFPNLVPSGVAPCLKNPDTGLALATNDPRFGRIDCTKSLVRLRANTAFSIYHSLQNQLRVQNWHGVTGAVSYTWSHTIDNMSEIFSTFAGGTTVSAAQNPFSIDGPERGNSGLDYRHVASAYVIYDLPWMKSQQGIVGHILGGWQVNSTWTYNSGQPFTVAQGTQNRYCDTGFNNAFFGADTCRPFLANSSAPLASSGFCTNAAAADCGLTDLNTGLPTTMDAVHWIINTNTASLFFGSPFNTVGRNTLNGQNWNNVNFGLYKNTKITERVNFQLRADVSNLFNRQYRGGPDPFPEDGMFNDDQTSPGFNPFGSALNNFFNTSNQRSITLGAKIVF